MDRPLRAASAALAALLTVALALGAVVGLPRPAGGRDLVGRAELRLADGTRIGTVSFSNPKGQDATTVEVDLAVPASRTPLKAFHGFHVHANNDPANGFGCVADPRQPSSTWFVSADGHLRRDAADAHANHAGDLPSLYLNGDGRARATFTIDRFSADELFDRAVVVHAGPDNFGNVPVGEGAAQYSANARDALLATANTGNAGDRVACGLIDLA